MIQKGSGPRAQRLLRLLLLHIFLLTLKITGVGESFRAEMNATRNLKGLQWRGGAIGNAEWTGARLRLGATLVGGGAV
jgi:hypothetical protein